MLFSLAHVKSRQDAPDKPPFYCSMKHAGVFRQTPAAEAGAEK
jgi:hypothetical protein